MTPIEITFWFSVAILFYCYVGYGIFLVAWNAIKRLFHPHNPPGDFELVPVTLVVAAYNEESTLNEKIKNTLEIDYPADLLQVIFITDGSTDGSSELVGQYPFITLLHQSHREGKSAAIKRAMRFVRTPVVIFSDANSMLNNGCIKAMIRHYADPRVGGVAGEKRISSNGHNSVIGDAEGLYWTYESFMKQQDSMFNTVVGAAGELFSIRTELFQMQEDNLILDDFIISMQVCLDGYKIQYEPRAYSMEHPSASLLEEEKRKIRIGAGAFQATEYLKQGLHFFKYPQLSFQYFSRRLLRWIACPILIVVVFLANIWLVVHQPGVIFNTVLLAQVVFYFLAFMGRVFIAAGARIGILNVPFYFLFMNVCLVKGFVQYIQGSQSVLWEKSVREA
ncbi:MAG TPA: glycosyltransferase family 2 protein [Chitinophagaceae bacterium]|nr:glycosyltransferase family 2 protein [Chitinophagaceae bacterium]